MHTEEEDANSENLPSVAQGRCDQDIKESDRTQRRDGRRVFIAGITGLHPVVPDYLGFRCSN